MTFTDMHVEFKLESQRSLNNFVYVLKNMLQKASEEDRVVSGVHRCVQILQDKPDNIYLCLLPEETETEDVASLTHKLIEAFCWENDIEVVKVDSFKNLEKILPSDATGESSQDCVLVEIPKDVQTSNDFTDNYYNFMSCNQCLVVTLPD